MTPTHDHTSTPPSAWVQRFASLIAPTGAVLDVAAGTGRHARWLAGLGLRVEAVDRDAAALGVLQGLPGIVTRVVDLEAAPWPYSDTSFDGVVVTNYLHRPLFPHLLAALRPGGVLIYETFMVGNETLGKPSNPDFLLRPGELLERVEPLLAVVAFEEGRVELRKQAYVQRICAVRDVVGRLPLDHSAQTARP